MVYKILVWTKDSHAKEILNTGETKKGINTFGIRNPKKLKINNKLRVR